MKKSRVIPVLTTVVAVLFIASIEATYAWYQYNSAVTARYNGTSIGSSIIFDIGVRSKVVLEDASKYNMKQDETYSDIYWANSEISSDALTYYSKSNGYATDYLNACSSGWYNEDHTDFKLLNAPTYLSNYYDSYGNIISATKRNYIRLELVFKVNEVTNSGLKPILESDIFMSNINFSSQGNIKNALRIHMDNNVEDFIFNPSSLEDGKDITGGVLDLNRDGLYDTNGDKEFLYGTTKENSLVYNESKTSDGEDIGEFKSTFDASHRNNYYAIDQEKTIFSESKFLGYNTIKNNKKILTSIDKNTGFATLNLDIYLEGWSSAVIDEEIDHKYSLGMNFEVYQNEN